MTGARRMFLAGLALLGLTVAWSIAYCLVILFGPGDKSVLFEYPWGRAVAPAGLLGKPGPISSLVITQPQQFAVRVRMRSGLEPVSFSSVTADYVVAHDVGNEVREQFCEVICATSRGYRCFGMPYGGACFWRDSSMETETIGIRPITEKAGPEFFGPSDAEPVQLPFSEVVLHRLFGPPKSKRVSETRGTFGH